MDVIAKNTIDVSWYSSHGEYTFANFIIEWFRLGDVDTIRESLVVDKTNYVKTKTFSDKSDALWWYNKAVDLGNSLKRK